MAVSVRPATAFEYRQISSAEGDAHTTIRVRKLSCQALVGGDPWGRVRDRRNLFQPVFLSTRLSLRQPFQSAAESDVVNDSTVNYSTLSKTILKVVASRHAGAKTDWSVNDFLDWIFLHLTGYSPDGGRGDRQLAASEKTGGYLSLEESSLYTAPLLKREDLKELELEVFLPKGSLLSKGINLTKSVYFDSPGDGDSSSRSIRQVFSSILKINDIQVATLIGINSNERTARQLVIASVEIEPYISPHRDSYNELEQIVFKTIEESSFETLESLAVHVAERVIDLFVYPYRPYEQQQEGSSVGNNKGPCSLVKVSLEKPSAVTFADTPVIEIVRSTKPVAIEGTNKPHSAKVPFPLLGRLDDWLKARSL
ncbi:MAG: hypothetical protein M1818_003415 [Claussenomyces sp. TS43310]|nr:MAG: hypothetical protein M1818_003415 [Claussenomyces sp. TS43310]